MQVPLEIVFRNMDRSDDIEAEVRNRAAWLEEFYGNITSCTVVVEADHHHKQKGNLYHIRVHLAVPGREITVDREPQEHHAHEDLRVTIHDAIDDARRQLQDYIREHRHKVKLHEPAAHGRIVKLFDEPQYGFIETPDGREVYFHFNAALGEDLHYLQVGSEVRFVEEQGDEGPQATSVRLVGRHHQLVE